MIFFLPFLELVSKVLCHAFIVTFGFWMQHFETGGLGEMVRHPGHHDRQISPPPLDFFLCGFVKNKLFSTPVADITILKASITDAFGAITEDMLEKTRREIDYRLDVLRATKRSTYWSVLMCCKKNLLSYILKKKKSLYSTYSSFLVINGCNQGKIFMLTLYNDVVFTEF